MDFSAGHLGWIISSHSRSRTKHTPCAFNQIGNQLSLQQPDIIRLEACILYYQGYHGLKNVSVNPDSVSYLRGSILLIDQKEFTGIS